MRNEPDVGQSSGGGLSQAARDHPVIAAVLLICTIGGAIAGSILLTGEWSVARRVAAGAVAGAGVGLFITAARMIG